MAQNSLSLLILSSFLRRRCGFPTIMVFRKKYNEIPSILKTKTV